MQKTILITIDVEDWFQVENFKPWIPYSTWDSRQLRVEKNTHRLLNLFDSIQLRLPSLPASQPQAHTYELSANSYELAGESKPKATFFVLGWLAERLPHLVREIHSRGHEVASHGYGHKLCNMMAENDLRKDLIDSKKLLEDITGSTIYGYRAPSFSIDDQILQIIKEAGYLYDSSYNSFGLHGRYGKLNLSGNGYCGGAYRITDNFYELPISNLKVGKLVFPFGGGGYFRLLPFPVFKIGVKNILKKNNLYLFYIHPWEIDEKQPRLSDASLGFKFRHYTNIPRTMPRIKQLMKKFDYCKFMKCSEYVETSAFYYEH
jgi:polysaccharide deacetylase family protein (PEP-CTERM system associated)